MGETQCFSGRLGNEKVRTQNGDLLRVKITCKVWRKGRKGMRGEYGEGEMLLTGERRQKGKLIS